MEPSNSSASLTSICLSDSKRAAQNVDKLEGEVFFSRSEICLALGLALLSAQLSGGRADQARFLARRPLAGILFSEKDSGREWKKHMQSFVANDAVEFACATGTVKDDIISILDCLLNSCQSYLDASTAILMASSLWKRRKLLLDDASDASQSLRKLSVFYENCKLDLQAVKAALGAEGPRRLPKRLLKKVPAAVKTSSLPDFRDIYDILFKSDRTRESREQIPLYTDSEAAATTSTDDDGAEAAPDQCQTNWEASEDDLIKPARHGGSALVDTISGPYSQGEVEEATVATRSTPKHFRGKRQGNLEASASTRRKKTSSRNLISRTQRSRRPPQSKRASRAKTLLSIERNLRFRGSLRCLGGLLDGTGTILDRSVALPGDVTLDDESGPLLFNAFFHIRGFLSSDRTLLADPDTPQLGTKIMLAASERMAQRVEREGFAGVSRVEKILPSSPGRPLTPTRFGEMEFPPIVTTQEAKMIRAKCHPCEVFSSVALNGDIIRWQDVPSNVVRSKRPLLTQEVRQALSLFEGDATLLGRRMAAVFELETKLQLLCVQFNEQMSTFPAHQDSTVGAIVEDSGRIGIVGGDGPGDVIVTRTLAGRATVCLERIDQTQQDDPGASVLVNFRKSLALFEQRAGETYALLGPALDKCVHCIDPTNPAPENFNVWGLKGNPTKGHGPGERISVTYRFVWAIESPYQGVLEGRISGMTKKEWSRMQTEKVVTNSSVFNALTRWLDAKTIFNALSNREDIMIVEGDGM